MAEVLDIVLIVLLIIALILIVGLAGALKYVWALVPRDNNARRRTWREFFYEKLGPIGSFPGVFLMYMPNALLMFGFIADILSQNFRYSAGSLVGVVAIIVNAIFSSMLNRFFPQENAAPANPIQAIGDAAQAAAEGVGNIAANAAEGLANAPAAAAEAVANAADGAENAPRRRRRAAAAAP